MLTIKEVSRTMKHRRQFRTLARDNCGESMEPGENEVIYFGYPPSDPKLQGNPIACASLLLAEPQCVDMNSREYFHWLTYIFVNERFKGEGHGTYLLDHIHYNAWQTWKRPVRADVARRAVPFFEKNGYVVNGDPWRPMAGSSYFNRLFPMELNYKEPEEEIWDV